MPVSSETSTHQLVGYVTKMFPTFGYINNEIFFQRKCVVGRMVEVGDSVAASAVYQPNMPIKWSAEKVWCIQDTREKENSDEKKYFSDEASRKSPKTDSRKSLDDCSRTSRDRDTPRDSRLNHVDRKRKDHDTRSHSRERPNSERDFKRRRLSPGISRSPRHNDLVLTKMESNGLLNTKELIVPELHSRYPAILCPVDLYRVVCHWQDTFPLLKPFQPDHWTVFQILPGHEVKDRTPKSKADNGFYVNVLLLAMPSITNLHEKTVIRAESSEKEKAPLRKHIKLLTASRNKERTKAIGGPWIPELDGEEPISNQQTLINTAIRICKEQLGLDLSQCSHWHRFMEFRYSRTEGSTARPISELFPGKHLWGRSLPDAAAPKSPNPGKPFHRIVLYFIPDIWSLMPAANKWVDVRLASERALSGPDVVSLPLSPAVMEMHLKAIQLAKAAEDLKAQELKLAAKETSDANNQSTADASSKKEDCNTTEGGTNLSITQPMETDAPNESITSPTADTMEKSGQEGTTCKSSEELNVSAMKVSELREQLKARNLPADGIKAQLSSRLKTALDKEIEEAKRLEERKRKEQEKKDEQAAQEAEKKKKEEEMPAPPQPVEQAPRKISLRNYPSIIIQPKLPAEYNIQAVGIDTILDMRTEFMDSRSYELMVCVMNLLDMLRRDSIFTLFRATVTAGDRGVQAKFRPKGANDSGAKYEVKIAPECTLRTIDLPLLFACTHLDIHMKNYFHSSEVEDLFVSLGLPVSRYQVRSLITKVAEKSRIYYRTLTDAEISEANVKSVAMFSEIDDDDYLVELIRGGDAILDDQRETTLPTGSVLVLQGSVLEGSETTDVASSSVSNPSVLAQHLSQLESDRNKLKKQLQLKKDEIDRLRILTDQIPKLKQKLSNSSASLEDYKRRLRLERDRIHLVQCVLEKQATNLDSSRTALRQAASRLRDRDEQSSVKKNNTDPKETKPNPQKAKATSKPSVAPVEHTNDEKSDNNTEKLEKPDEPIVVEESTSADPSSSNSDQPPVSTDPVSSSENTNGPSTTEETSSKVKV